MRVRMNDSRERLYGSLVETAPSGTKSGALDDAARYYCKMAGGNAVNPRGGRVEQLMALAVDQGSVTPEEIADVLDVEELPVRAETDWSVGES